MHNGLVSDTRVIGSKSNGRKWELVLLYHEDSHNCKSYYWTDFRGSGSIESTSRLLLCCVNLQMWLKCRL